MKIQSGGNSKAPDFDEDDAVPAEAGWARTIPTCESDIPAWAEDRLQWHWLWMCWAA